MSDFGDWEPEDSWDADDPIATQIDNLFARLDVLDNVPRAHRYGELLDAIEHRLQPWRGRLFNVDNRTALRIEQLDEDLDFLRSRDG